MTTMEEKRARCVRAQIERRGVKDARLLDAMRTVPREIFVPEHLREESYDDGPLPIGEGQTISQPFIVALMVEALRLVGGERVLEVGAGSGYAAAVLAELADEVYAVERIPRLSELARENLSRAGYRAVHVRCADGAGGWPEAAPFDAILVSAGASSVPAALKEQLAIGGRMVLPVGPSWETQELMRLTRVGPSRFEEERLGGVRFVPLVTGDNPPPAP